MTIRPTGRIVIPTVPALAACVIAVRERAIQTMEVRVGSCCAWTIEPCIVQGAAKVFRFDDLDTVDYSGATEITFDVWRRETGGANLLSKSLSAADITLPDSTMFSLSVSNAESAALPAGRHYCEAWVTLSTGERRCVGLGDFVVIDSRKHD